MVVDFNSSVFGTGIEEGIQVNRNDFWCTVGKSYSVYKKKRLSFYVQYLVMYLLL